MNSKRYRISSFNNFVVDTELNSRNNKALAEYPSILNVIHNNEVNMKEHLVYCDRTDVRTVGAWVDGAGWLARDESTSCQSKSVKLNGNAKTDEASSMHLKRVSAHEFLASGPATSGIHAWTRSIIRDMAAERADGETKPEGHRRNENEKSSLRLCRRKKKPNGQREPSDRLI